MKYHLRRNDPISQVTYIIRQAVCYYQESIIPYTFLAAEKHRRLKDYLRSKEINAVTNNIDKLESLLMDLVDFSNSNLDAAFWIAVKHINSYFELEGRSCKCKPRFTVKAPYKGLIYDMFRDSGKAGWPPFRVSENTGFQRVLQDETYFLCNDIPNSAKKGVYKNLRLNMERVAEYKSSRIKIWPDDPLKDAEWEKCWLDESNQNSDFSAYYKSTLIIPIAFRVGNTSTEFKKNFEVNDSEPRKIYGFLCLDHRDTFFFNNGSDVDLGYVIADLLSLYLITRAIYLSHSSTFEHAKKILQQHDRWIKDIPLA
jgi:hypothetical protein